MCIVLLHVNYLDYDNRGLGGLEKRRVLKEGFPNRIGFGKRKQGHKEEGEGPDWRKDVGYGEGHGDQEDEGRSILGDTHWGIPRSHC